MKKIDYKKEYKDLYLPKTTPMIIDVPQMIFVMVDGKGNPNTSEAYMNAMAVVYGISWTIKMSKMNDDKPDGYFEYVIPPLEGIWWLVDDSKPGLTITNKDDFMWTSMIRLPEFVTKEVFTWALEKLKEKKPELDFSTTRYQVFKEGKCAQVMHIGSYDNEGETVAKLDAFVVEQGYTLDFTKDRKHHEIYLGDPRKTKPENLKTIIRHPIR